MVDIERMAIDPVYAEIVKMNKREADGKLAYRNTQASLRLTRIHNKIPDSVFTQYVYGPMDSVINKINTGNWLDAYNIINSVQSNPYLSVNMLLSFKNQIANYIVGEGDYQEYTGKTVDLLTGLIS